MSDPDPLPVRSGPTLENRLPAEGINSSEEHPLREFAWLIGASLAALLAIVALVGWGAQWLAPRLPFSAETTLAERLPDPPQPAADAQRSAALQALADKVAATMALPPDMSVKLAFDDSSVVNAYASLGGRIRVYAGLLSQLRSEDELAALLAHEIAHVKHRHVAANMGRGLTMAMLLGMVSSDAGATVAQSALGQATGLVLLGYSRGQEEEADDEALRAVVALYGHAGGVTALFEHLGEHEARENAGGVPLPLLNSHPRTAQRLQAQQTRAQASGWATAGTLTPLPATLVLPRK